MTNGSPARCRPPGTGSRPVQTCWSNEVPSGNLTVCFGKWPSYSWCTLLEVVIFNSYVRLLDKTRV
jgi:hypothetical protein